MEGGGMQDQTNNYNKWMFMGSDYYSACDIMIHYTEPVPTPGACAQEDKMQEEEIKHKMEAAECTMMISDTLILFFPSKVVWKWRLFGVIQ